MDKEKIEREDAQIGTRAIKRKPDMPKVNTKDFQKENERMGVKNEVDLILDTVQKAEAKTKYAKELIGYSKDAGQTVKQEKERKYLTVQGLLDHPYFMSINEADISIVIDEFERL